MSLDRAGAKAAVSDKEAVDPQLEAGISNAIDYRLKIAEHTHAQKLIDKELGWLGRFLGGEKSAPTAVASIVIGASILIFFAMYLVAAFGSLEEDRAKFIINAGDKCLALGTLALGYVCGKGR